MEHHVNTRARGKDSISEKEKTRKIYLCHSNETCPTSETSQVNLDNKNDETVRSVMSNYIIVKKIMENLNWQGIRTTSSVCKLWHEVATNINKLNLDPQHFCLINPSANKTISYKIDKEPKSEPMLILTFLEKKAMLKFLPCHCYSGYRCDETCSQKYKMLNYLHVKLSHPSNVLVGVTCDEPIFPASKACLPAMSKESVVGGLYIPQVAGVKVHKFRQQTIRTCGSRGDFVREKILTLMETEYVKCLLIFPSATFCHLYNALIDDIIGVIELTQGKQCPFAIGGCMVYGTQFDEFDSVPDRGYLNFIVITTERSIPENLINFDAFSKIIALKKDSKEKILANIVQMSELIPRREYSVALKLSCVGRSGSHSYEETSFTKYFPHTKTIGCFGLGEIGVDHLPCPISSNEPDEETKVDTPTKKTPKRPRVEKLRKHELFYQYSSVMVILSWGNLK